MPRSALTGSRIRARRIDLGLRQSSLAEACGISPSYLNLIEHNRRRIGGKLLIDLARELDVEVSTLSEGADAALLQELRSAAAAARRATAETNKAEEFAGRFPGWARLVSEQSRRIAALEQALETLNDRLAHDPFLSASLHDILSTVTAIRSTSSILATESDIDPAWQARFHRNLHEDSQRLAEASRSLVTYLDTGGEAAPTVLSAQDEFEDWLEGEGYDFPAIEAGADEAEVLRDAEGLVSEGSRALAREHLRQFRADSRSLPRERFLEMVASHGPDPSALAAEFGASFPAVFRRLAALAGGRGARDVGLVVCDGSGALLFRKTVEGFPLPRYGAACPLWPLFVALTRPMAPVRQIVEIAGRDASRFLTCAISETAYPEGFEGPQVTRAYMLILPWSRDDRVTAQIVGTSCRICPREACSARREPSIVQVNS